MQNSKPRPPLSRPRPPTNPYQLYEYLKSALSPDLTPKEYEAACQRIARALGI